MTAKSDYLENAVLNSALRGVAWPVANTGNNYIGLHTADPGEGGAGTETSGGGYARAPISRATGSSGWGAPSDASGSQQVANSVAVTFPTPSGNWAGPITHFGVWDAISGGNLLYKGALGTSRTVNNGDSAPSFAIGALTISES